MNCAYHADQSAVAYCRTCGKALCANCTRPVRGVIYCEECLGARMEGTQAGSGAAPVAGAAPVPLVPMPAPSTSGGGPNPTVAGILAGFFPFGVGAVYTGQYAKGLAHLAIFALLIVGINAGSDHSDALLAFSIIGLIFFIVYQIIDSVRTARALQAGLPPPDPYGLAATFGAGTKVEASRIPVGATVLIGLGILFLLNTLGVDLGLHRFWPLILIGVGGWLLARNWGWLGLPGGETSKCMACQCSRCRARRLMGPAVLLTIGFLFLIETLGKVGFHRTWPILLLVIGGVKLFQGGASTEGHVLAAPSIPPKPAGDVPRPPAPPEPPSPPSEVNRG